MQPASNFYKTFAIDCSRAQISVDMFLFSAHYQDVATLGKVPFVFLCLKAKILMGYMRMHNFRAFLITQRASRIIRLDRRSSILRSMLPSRRMRLSLRMNLVR